jgi:hypothetical protein
LNTPETNPERDIEKLLHKAADHRRAQAPSQFVLPPGTRASLRAEIQRKYHARGRRGIRLLELIRIPYLAWGFGIVAIISFLTWQLARTPITHEKNVTIARTESPGVSSARPEQLQQRTVSTAESPPQITVVPKEFSYTDTVTNVAAASAVTANISSQLLAVVPSAPTQVARSLGNEVAANYEPQQLTRLRDKDVVGKSTESVSGETRAFQLAAGRGVDSNLNVQSFATLAAHSATADRANLPVLSSFRLVQNGDEIRVVDGDGSIYSGSIQLAPELSKRVGDNSADVRLLAPSRGIKPDISKTAAGALPKSEAAPASKQYFFRVTGTNRTLNQKVVFAGNFLGSTNSVSPGSGISGRVTLGNGQEFPLNAAPK